MRERGPGGAGAKYGKLEEEEEEEMMKKERQRGYYPWL